MPSLRQAEVSNITQPHAHRVTSRQRMRQCHAAVNRTAFMLTLCCLLCSALSSLLRIVRAFLIEEQKIVKAVLKQRGGGKKAATVAEK
jgi:hypothetical protein